MFSCYGDMVRERERERERYSSGLYIIKAVVC